MGTNGGQGVHRIFNQMLRLTGTCQNNIHYQTESTVVCLNHQAEQKLCKLNHKNLQSDMEIKRSSRLVKYQNNSPTSVSDDRTKQDQFPTRYLMFDHKTKIPSSHPTSPPSAHLKHCGAECLPWGVWTKSRSPTTLPRRQTWAPSSKSMDRIICSLSSAKVP